jgi:hypothetical protein
MLRRHNYHRTPRLPSSPTMAPSVVRHLTAAGGGAALHSRREMPNRRHRHRSMMCRRTATADAGMAGAVGAVREARGETVELAGAADMQERTTRRAPTPNEYATQVSCAIGAHSFLPFASFFLVFPSSSLPLSLPLPLDSF